VSPLITPQGGRDTCSSSCRVAMVSGSCDHDAQVRIPVDKPAPASQMHATQGHRGGLRSSPHRAAVSPALRGAASQWSVDHVIMMLRYACVSTNQRQPPRCMRHRAPGGVSAHHPQGGRVTCISSCRVAMVSGSCDHDAQARIPVDKPAPASERNPTQGPRGCLLIIHRAAVSPALRRAASCRVLVRQS
jgi:hypothetical protein